MSFYNMINGVNPAAFLILPMLGEKHPDDYPRFRDCFVKDNNEICVYTRVGGENRNCGFGEEELYNHPNFLRTEDDDFDSTFGSYYFSVPEEWKEDYEKIIAGNIKGTSDKYKERLFKVFPKLEEQLKMIFN